MVSAIDYACPQSGKFRQLIGLTLVALVILSPPWPALAQNDGKRIDLSGLAAEVSTNGLPAHWQHLNFPSISSETRYDVVTDETYGPVIRARSSAGAGGIIREISEDPSRYPLLEWSWKIEQTVSGSSLTSKNGDDFPARLMVSFKSGSPEQNRLRNRDRQNKTLCYVWAADDPVGAFSVNPHHDHVMTIVAASGSSKTGSWVEISRNVVEDFVKAFSEKPLLITGVALMTDSDNTGSEAQAWYGPVWLSSSESDN